MTKTCKAQARAELLGPAEAPPPMRIEKHDEPGKLNVITGCHEDHLSLVLINQLLNSLHLFPNGSNISDDYREGLKKAAVIALEGIGPKTEAEGLLAVQMVACHSAAMECFRRAMLSGQTVEARGMELNFANKLSRTYATLLETLNDCRRGKGRQKVTVKHVHVHSGGQAIVGHVKTGGSQSKTEVQSHAQALTHAPEPEVQSSCQDDRETLPERLNGQREV